MKKVYATIPHEPEKGKMGDCFRCCVASILELDAEDVPHFVQKGDNDGYDPRWFVRLHTWLRQFNLEPVMLDAVQCRKKDALNNFQGDCYHIITGRSPRGEWNHSVVGYQQEIVHDPDPSGDGVEDMQDFIVFAAIYPQGVCTHE